MNTNKDNERLSTAIRELCREKHALVLAHYYTRPEVQDVADIVGDSLELARKAAKASERGDVKTIVMCGVGFMGETCKVLCPELTVLIPDTNAGCSLADSCPEEAFREFVEAHPGYKVATYVNTSAKVKTLSDVVVTSGNALAVVESFPKDEPIIFAPDKNLGNWINAMTGRSMLLWNGGCHVHEAFSLSGVLALKHEHPEAKVLVHPECPAPLAHIADKVGSTAVLLRYCQEDEAKTFIVATESGILHQMQRLCPGKLFIPAPVVGEGSVDCGCGECAYMKLITLQKVHDCLVAGKPCVELDRETAEKARRPIERMLELSQPSK